MEWKNGGGQAEGPRYFTVNSSDGGLLTLDRHSSGTPGTPGLSLVSLCTLRRARRGGEEGGEEEGGEEERGREEIGW